MSENNKELSTVETSVKENSKAEKKNKNKSSEKKPNIFVRIWKMICKFVKDVLGEMKKVVWTSKDELKKSTKLVLVIVIAVAAAIAVIDTSFSWLINSIAGLIG